MKRLSISHKAASLAILSMVPVAMTLIRPMLSNTDSYIYMNWNLLLAFLPLLFAWFFEKKIGGKIWSLIFLLLWIGFLPNAPYLITDLIHLADVGPRDILWYDSIMLFSFAWVGMLFWLKSIKIIYLHYSSFLFIPFVSLLTAIGLYLGRYLRFNTWDIISNPQSIIASIVDIFLSPLSHEPFLSFSLTFWVFLMFSYLGYWSLHKDTDIKKDA